MASTHAPFVTALMAADYLESDMGSSTKPETEEMMLRIEEFLRENPHSTSLEMSKGLKVDMRTMYNYIKLMFTKKRIVRRATYDGMMNKIWKHRLPDPPAQTDAVAPVSNEE